MGNMTDDEIISDKFREAYRDFLQNQSNDTLFQKFSDMFTRQMAIDALIDRSPTGEDDPEFEDIRANL